MNNVSLPRFLRSLNQTQLAEKAGTSQPHISRIEKRDMGVTIGLFIDVAAALEVPLSARFIDCRSKAEQAVIDACSSLPPDDL